MRGPLAGNAAPAVDRPRPGFAKSRLCAGGLLFLITLFAFCLQGYHPGAEDDGIYLSAIKKDLRPSLYPYNSDFFMVQVKATVFDGAVAASVRLTHMPVAYACLLWQLAAIALLLAGGWRIVAFCFRSLQARVAGVLTVGCVLTLSAAGTGLYLADEHLHPRTLATDAILFAIAATQRGRPWRAVLLLLVAVLFHPLMGAFGVSFCLLYVLVARFWQRQAIAETAAVYGAAILPGGWIFTAPTPAWRLALAQHTYYTLSTWQWYEWLGALAPPVLLALLARTARRRRDEAFACITAALAVYSTVQLALALAVLLPPGGERFTPLQPMRFLQLTFLMMALLGGAALGEYVLRAQVGRWLLVFLPLAAVNGYAQKLRYPATRNLELPWLAPSSDWFRAFAWVRGNTPEDAVFALDPLYLALPGEDNHSFRALAERASLADDLKDAAAVTQVPSLAGHWLAEHKEEEGWRGWGREDFLRLARDTPVRWVVVAPAQAADAGIPCPYTNATVSVCKLPY